MSNFERARRPAAAKELVKLNIRILTDEGSRLQNFKTFMPVGSTTDQQLVRLQQVARSFGFTVVES